MHLRPVFAAFVLCATSCVLPPTSAEEGVRYYAKDGLMYCETRIKLRHPVSEMKYKELKQTYYRDQYVTELKPIVRNTYVPVTTYAWQPEIVGKWNPFESPYVSYRPVPKVSWSVQPQTVQVPVTRRVTIPETRTTRVPQTNLRYEEREYVRRVPVGPAPTRATGPQTQSATGAETNGAGPQLQRVYRPPDNTSNQREVFGGVARLETDPPRFGVGTQNSL